MSLDALFDFVVARLADSSPSTSIVFGEREIAKQINQGTGRANRVVFAPGDEGGALGSYEPPARPGMRSAVGATNQRARSLWDWRLAARVYVWAYDGTAAEDERAQWRAMVELHDLVVEAIHAFAPGHYAIRAPRATGKTIERRFGRETMFILEYAQPVVAAPRATTGEVTGSGSVVFVGPTGTEEPVC